MDKAIYVAMTNGQQMMNAMAVHSNNLANATTTGFLADFARASTASIEEGAGFHTHQGIPSVRLLLSTKTRIKRRRIRRTTE